MPQCLVLVPVAALVYVMAMTTNARSRGFLAGLWRERTAFSALALLILLGNFIHPLAEARAAGTANAWMICSSYGTVRDPSAPTVPGAADDCPMCIAGHGSCALPVLADAAAVPVPQPGVQYRPAPVAARSPAIAPAATSPAIRAPPARS